MSRFPQPKVWKPTNPEKYLGDYTKIISRSSWETKFMHWCDVSQNIIGWNSEDFRIPYYSPVDNRMHTYHVDFFIKIKLPDGTIKKYLVEVKPSVQTLPPKNTRNKRVLAESVMTYQTNMAKWEAAKKYCKQMGWEFIVITEKELGINKKYKKR